MFAPTVTPQGETKVTYELRYLKSVQVVVLVFAHILPTVTSQSEATITCELRYLESVQVDVKVFALN